MQVKISSDPGTVFLDPVFKQDFKFIIFYRPAGTEGGSGP
jgi:hypothetical protein